MPNLALQDNRLQASFLKDNSLQNRILTDNDKKNPRKMVQNTQSLHIVLVTETWLPDINGVASSLYQLMRQLKQMGHCITLIRPEHPEKNAQAEPIEQQIKSNFSQTTPQNSAYDIDFSSAIDRQITVKAVPIPYYATLRMGVPKFRALISQLQQLNPDIVHIATEGPLGLQAWRVSRKLGLKVSTGYHTAFHDFSRHLVVQKSQKLTIFSFLAPIVDPILSSLVMGYLKFLHNRCDATCVPSAKTCDELTKLGFKRLTVVGRGVDKSLFFSKRRSQILRASWGAGEQTTVLLYVGRVSPEKGIDTVIKGFRALQLAQLHREIKLIIVGDGPDKARLLKENHHNTNIIFAGFQTGVALAEHYASADAFVFASQVETFGNVVTEAMASGVPVFAYHDAAAAMLVGSDCGHTVTVGDEPAFIGMIANLPKLCQLHAMRAVAEMKVADFGWQVPAQVMLAMFYQVLGLEYQAKQSAIGEKDIAKSQTIKTLNLSKSKPIFLPALTHASVNCPSVLPSKSAR